MRAAWLAVALALAMPMAPTAGQGAGAGAGKPAKAERKPRGDPAVWDAESPLELVITANLGQLRKDQGDEPPWRRATLELPGAAGAPRAIPVRLRTRGVWRRRNCVFPPLRIDVQGKAARETPFAGLDRPKLVTHCRPGDEGQRYLLRELQLYRMQRLLTPWSHRARLLRIAWTDSATRKVAATSWAILLEEPKALGARMGAIPLDQKGAKPGDLEEGNDALLGVFQYLIGNTDWSVSALHNVELYALEGQYYAVAYDFDFAGAVNASYASVDPKVGVATVRDRVYRGYCVPAPALDSAVAIVVSRRAAIEALYRDDVGRLLGEDDVEDALAFLRDFWREAARGGFARGLASQCRQAQ